jgi:hypothetical protein
VSDKELRIPVTNPTDQPATVVITLPAMAVPNITSAMIRRAKEAEVEQEASGADRIEAVEQAFAADRSVKEVDELARIVALLEAVENLLNSGCLPSAEQSALFERWEDVKALKLYDRLCNYGEKVQT